MIQAYNINRFYTCQLTGACVAEVIFRGSNLPETQAFLHTFSSKDAGVAFVTREGRDWFLGQLEAYVNHKKHIITSAHPEQEAALKVCENALEHYFKWELPNIAEKFIGGFKYFQSILPHPRNAGYESSLHNLNELYKFCVEFLRFKKQVG